MKHLSIDVDKALEFIDVDKRSKYINKITETIKNLHSSKGKGNDFMGWVKLPSLISDSILSDIEETANVLRKTIDVMVVIGIGGSYLGAKAVNTALSDSFSDFREGGVKVVYAGQNISEDYLSELIEYLKDKSFALCVISKSGTTTEPAIAFRLLKSLLENKEGLEEARKRIVAITDESKGALRVLSDREGYKSYVIPDNVGGRYSVLTPVGLLPIAVAGFDIRKIVEGASYMQDIVEKNDYENNPSAQYANIRNILLDNGYNIELLANFEPKLHYISEWWKQLYGESEGKEGKGIFPASVDFTTDLHSMGQYVQEGRRELFETVISVERVSRNLEIPFDEDNLDKLNYLAGKRISEVNKMAELGTKIAHVEGGVPNIRIELPELDEYYLGELIYFFEIACGISGNILNVNPFDQPGVEEYKSNMFALLGKPGFEQESEKIKKKL